MECTISELFTMIAQKRSVTDYYQEDCVFEVKDYLQAITGISAQEKKVVVSDCHKEPLNEPIDKIAGKIIDAARLMVYYFVIHDDDFCIVRMSDYEELDAFMKAGVKNSFIGDMVVFENGKEKKILCEGQKRTGYTLLFRGKKTGRRGLY